MKKKIISVVAVLFLLTLCICASWGANKSQAEALLISENRHENKSENMESRNPYFYQKDGVMLEANAEYQCFEEFKKTPVKILEYVVKEYTDGVLYKLAVDTEGQLADAELSDAEARLGMYFYVTQDQIYRVQPYLVVGQEMITFYDNDRLLTLLLNSDEKIVNNSQLVCGMSDTFSNLEEGAPGVHEGIVRNGDQISYSRCDVKPNGTPGFYEQFIWEKGKGLVHYESGYGAEREILNLEDIRECDMLLIDSQVQNPFFFSDSSAKPRYEVSSNILLKEEVELLILENRRLEHGIIYELRIDCDEDFLARYHYDWDRCCLGYLYVDAEKIYFLGYTAEDAEAYETEEDILEKGVIVCQEEERQDALEPEEKGWHEYVLADGDIREYHGFATWGDTNFYMHFFWEREVGLVEYTTGWGALRDDITLTLCRE